MAVTASSGAQASEEALLDALFDELWPIHRSITGPGIEQSIAIFRRHMPLAVEKVPSGTKVFDWVVPDEWHCRSARLTGPDGEVICDLAASNLHVMSYSEPMDRVLPLAEIQKHLHSLPELPDAVPYVTSYYKRNWGFCISENRRNALKDGAYHAKIDSAFVKGGVPFAEAVLPGESTNEVLISSYLCHPSLANNELSGPLGLLALYLRLKDWPRRRYTYRFVLNPETIGSLCYLSRRGDALRSNLVAGLVLTCLGGPGETLSYKQSRRENSLLDRLVAHQVARGSANTKIKPFSPTSGSDERQFCSPGFNLPVGRFSRTFFGEYAGYHNSLDDKSCMGLDTVLQSVDQLERVLRDLEIAGGFLNQAPYGEPQLGKRNLYPNMNSAVSLGMSSDDVFDGRVFLDRLLTVLSYSDGEHDMISIANRLDCPIGALRPVIEKLEAAALLKLAERAA